MVNINKHSEILLIMLVFIVISLITNVIAPLSGAPVIFVGYYAFGNNVIFLATIAAYISFVINFWIARKWGRPLVQRFVCSWFN